VRTGSRPLVLAGAAGYLAALPLAGLAPGAGAFAAAFALVAAANGALDVSMNAQGVAVQRGHDRRVFASFHAAFSFGALAGAGAGALAVLAGLDPAAHLAAAAVLLAGVLVAARGGLLPAAADARADGPVFARPSPALAGLGLLAFCALLSEGAVTDWSAILLDRDTAAGPAVAALGLAAFQLTMGAGRLAADPLADRFGPRAVVRAGGVLAAAGLALALAGGTIATGLAGFALTGAGLAGAFPLTLAAAGHHPPAAPSLAAVSTTGYAGFIVGPALIGLPADRIGLASALGGVVVLCLAVSALAGATGR
jgi:hypothetical protein